VRVGTWNVEGKWTAAHEAILIAAACQVWLLTEVAERTRLPGYHRHLTQSEMLPGKRWAGVFSQEELVPAEDPHFASAVARVGELTFCSSVLPWRSATEPPWTGSSQGERTQRAVATLVESLPTRGLVWSGDWNHWSVRRRPAAPWASGRSSRAWTGWHFRHPRSGCLDATTAGPPLTTSPSPPRLPRAQLSTYPQVGGCPTTTPTSSSCASRSLGRTACAGGPVSITNAVTAGSAQPEIGRNDVDSGQHL
jgi:hypothetical protein